MGHRPEHWVRSSMQPSRIVRVWGCDVSELVLHFEIDDLAVDENGKPAPAGAQITLDTEVEFTPERVEAVRLKLAAMFESPPSAVRHITAEQYRERGYDQNEQVVE